MEPYGVLLGTRHYLIGRDPAKDNRLRRFRLDRISKTEITLEWFEKDKDFDLDAYVAQSFGAFHADTEVSRVVWRFSPAAVVTAPACHSIRARSWSRWLGIYTIGTTWSR
ncbi:helix-turn-helix transcriptional regulator [Roseovarius sp.]|uniref:helix-turn-helix transcriptional regulator n=1 Tax=Roseovarius sp. TaxID=1486281 RepID=UPI003566337F